MLFATMLLAINWTTIIPSIETVAVSGVRFRALDYGRVRLWGSIGVIVASLGAGLIIGRVVSGGGGAAAGRGDRADDPRRAPSAARDSGVRETPALRAQLKLKDALNLRTL